jgi:hypothetical protein
MKNKPNSQYKMSKFLKTMLAGSFKNSHDRGEFKRIMIDAEIESFKRPKMTKAEKETISKNVD